MTGVWLFANEMYVEFCNLPSQSKLRWCEWMSAHIVNFRMIFRAAKWGLQLVREGQTRFLLRETWMRVYKELQEGIYPLRRARLQQLSKPFEGTIALETLHPIAFESPDHLIPWGTSRDNSTNKKFVAEMAGKIGMVNKNTILGVLDLGCSGGQLVADFRELGWAAVGLEGSDFSLKHKRANWPALAGKNLFTCDVTKPFTVRLNGQPGKFHLITMWEVLEHIPTADLLQLFRNITAHLATGGYFVATTTSRPDIHDGVDLHQTKWTNAEWKAWLAKNFPELKPVDLTLKYYQFVRHNDEGSFLTYCRA
jgi:SAM-dependent methyltransferase